AVLTGVAKSALAGCPTECRFCEPRAPSREIAPRQNHHRSATDSKLCRVIAAELQARRHLNANNSQSLHNRSKNRSPHDSAAGIRLAISATTCTASITMNFPVSRPSPRLLLGVLLAAGAV